MSDESNACDAVVKQAYAEKHLDVLQGIIQRMAGNSSAAKNWSITVSSAVLAFAIESEKPLLALLALLPALVLWMLDSYYLALERGFIKIYNDAMERAASEKLTVMELKIKPPTPGKEWWSTFWSRSVLPFHGIIVLMIFIMNRWVL